jgi:hypothetical protein
MQVVSAVPGLQREGAFHHVDLGYGDFRVGSNFVTPDIDYTGIDIVTPLIDRNNQKFLDMYTLLFVIL